MDERFRGKGLWIGLGALAIVFMCVMLCGFGAMASFTMGRGPVYVQPPAGEEGVAPPPAYYGSGPWGMARHGGFNPFAFIFKMAFLGLFLLLLIGLLKRIFWGPRYWGPRHWHPPYRGKPPEGEAWKGKPHGMWGPWAHHWCAEHWGPGGEPADEEGVSSAPDAQAESDMEFSPAE
jgi:hypothetical protein